MSVLLWTITGSGSALLALMLLFYIEKRRGKRVAEPLRRLLDRVIDWCVVRWHTLMLYIGSGAGRVGVHYLLHRILRVVMIILEALQSVVQRWQKRNRRIARSVQIARTETHLTAIAQHKHSTALSDEEKEALKHRSLEG